MNLTTRLDLQAVQPGQVFDAGPLMSNLTPEKVTLKCTYLSDSQARFEVRWLGVYLGVAQYVEEGETWEWVK